MKDSTFEKAQGIKAELSDIGSALEMLTTGGLSTEYNLLLIDRFPEFRFEVLKDFRSYLEKLLSAKKSEFKNLADPVAQESEDLQNG